MSCAEVIVLADFAAARWLGHGRAMELYLACVTAIYGIALLTQSGNIGNPTTADLAWFGYDRFFAIPLLAHAALAGSGLIGNILGWPWSRWARFAGAMLGCAMWTWVSVKLGIVGNFSASGFVFGAPAALFCVRIMGMALADLPHPGSPSVIR